MAICHMHDGKERGHTMSCDYAKGKCFTCSVSVKDGMFDVRKISDIDNGMVPNKKYCARCRWIMRSVNMAIINEWHR